MAKLGTAETGDTLSDKDNPLLMEPWSMPEPLLPVAIVAKSKADDDKLSQGLSRLVAEDPTLRLENNPETHQLVLWTMGEAHTDVLLDRLANRYGVAVETVDLRVPLRETIGGKAQGLGRNVKQTGGHGEYGICPRRGRAAGGLGRLRVRRQDRRRRGAAAVHPVGGEGRPLADGAGRAGRLPDDRGAGHPVRRQGALGRLLRHGLPEGRAAGPEGRGGQGPAHPARAGRRGQRAGAGRLRRRGDVATCPRRRGRVLGTEPVGVGRTLVKAEIPELEITRYTIDLRSLSHGTGSFTREYLRHEPLPSHLASKVAAEAKG